MNEILKKLAEGDLRSIGRSEEVVSEVLANPVLFGELIAGLESGEPGVRMRAADAIEKITARRPELLQPYRAVILNEMTAISQQEVRWHICQILPRLALSSEERKRAAAMLESYLLDKSRIVRTFALQALADLALEDEELAAHVIELLETQAGCGIPSVESRSKKLLGKLKKL